MNKTEKIKAFWLLAFCGLILWVAFYPGFMSHDSIVQFGMSKSLNFNDWHPPIMAWVWSVVGFFSWAERDACGSPGLDVDFSVFMVG